MSIECPTWVKVILAICASILINAHHPMLNTVKAQNYSSNDTVTEYPNYGTFYHDRFEGRKTASGEVFDQNKFTAAHWRIKLGTYVMVTNRNTGLQVIVKVNDRCPKRGVFDMSHRAAAAIGIRGCQPVTIRILPAGYEERWANQETMFDSVSSRHYPNVRGNTSPSPSTTNGGIPVFNHPHPTRGESYNLWLATVASHSDVYSLTQHIPTAYHDNISIETLEGSDSLCMTLTVRLPKKEAEQLARSLKKHFPKAQIKPAE